MNDHDQLTLSTHTYRAGWDLGLLLQIWALMTHWFSWLESWSQVSFFKVSVLVFWLFFGHKLSISKWRRTFVGRGRHRALFTNLCCVLIVESLNDGHWPVISWSLLVDHHFHGCTSLYYVSDDFFQPITYGVVLLVFGLTSLGPGTQSLGFAWFWAWTSESWSWSWNSSLGLGLEQLSLDNKCGCMWEISFSFWRWKKFWNG